MPFDCSETHTSLHNALDPTPTSLHIQPHGNSPTSTPSPPLGEPNRKRQLTSYLTDYVFNSSIGYVRSHYSCTLYPVSSFSFFFYICAFHTVVIFFLSITYNIEAKTYGDFNGSHIHNWL